MRSPFLLFVVWALALAAALPLRAQDLPEPGDGFTWERVGDRPIQLYDLAFGQDSTLWAAGVDGPHRLDLASGFPGTWVLTRDFFVETLLPLGTGGPQGDTLLAGRGLDVVRSLDGGATFARVHEEGGMGALYEVPVGYPFDGRLLAGNSSASSISDPIAYSDDRGATFTASVVPRPGGNTATASDFVALPPGSSHPGRVLGAGRWGVYLSDDGGATFRESGLWGVLVYNGEALGVVEHAGAPGGVRAVMAGRVSAAADARAWTSDDGGETWGPDGGGVRLVESPPQAAGSAVGLLELGGPSALVVLYGGTVYRTDDGAETWAPVGRAPEIDEHISARTAALGPDGRLYVGLLEAGPDGEGWVWRTAERLTVTAGEVPPEAGDELRMEVAPNPSRGSATVTLVMPAPGAVEAALYDVLGRRVAVLHEGTLAAGTHAFVFDGAAFQPGVYVVRVTARGSVVTRLVTLVR